MFIICVINEIGILVIPEKWIFSQEGNLKCAYPTPNKFTQNMAQYMAMKETLLGSENTVSYDVCDIIKKFGK